MSDYGEYNGDTVHDMWVDYTYQENTGELSDWYEVDGGGWYYLPSYVQYRQSKSTSQLISECKSRLHSNKVKIANVEVEIEHAKKSIENPAVSPKKKVRLQKLLNVTYPNRLDRYHQSVKNDEAKLTSLLINREKELNRWTICICISAILASLFIFWIIYH